MAARTAMPILPEADVVRAPRSLRPSDGGWRPRSAPAPFPAGVYSPAVVARLGDAWADLRRDERRSVVGATMVATDLARIGAPAEILGEMARIIEDEVRHVAVCTGVLEALGATPGSDERLSDDVERSPPFEDGGDIETRCAGMLLAGFAVGEPMSAVCFAAARRRAREPLLRWALTELLRDEARHGPIAVRAGTWVVRSWSRARREALWPACVAQMERFERNVCGPIPEPPAGHEIASSNDDPVLEALGLLGPAANCAAVLDAIRRLVLPPLATLGIIPERPAAANGAG